MSRRLPIVHRGRDASIVVTRLEEPFIEPPFPPLSSQPSLIYLAQMHCVYCGAALEIDPAPSSAGDTRVWRHCSDCGTAYFSDPGDESAMRTRELLTYHPGDMSVTDRESERRRRYLLARLSRGLNRLTDESDQARGYGFQDPVEKLFRIEDVSFEHGSRRGSREADGFVEVDGWYYLLEINLRAQT